MATIRILATVCAALFAGLTLTLGSAALVPAAAQTAAEAPPGRPLNLLPQLGKAKKFTRQARTPSRVAQTKTIHRVAIPSHGRAFAPPECSRRREPPGRSLRHARPGQPRLPGGKQNPAAHRRLAQVAAPGRCSRHRPPARGGGPRSNLYDRRDRHPLGLTADAPTADISTADLTNADTVQVADAGEINEIDLAANETPALAANETPAPPDKSWLNALLAVLGGAFAAAAAASFLFARRRQPLRLSF